MCKKLWQWLFPPKPDPIPIIGNNVALLFAIGSGYPGTQNDLVGPPYDLKNVANFIMSKYPNYSIRKIADTDVTRQSFENVVKTQIALMNPGDNLLIYYSGHGTNGIDSSEPDGYREGIYLTDGPYWDDEFSLILQDIKPGAKVTVVLDSCFAHGSTAPKNSTYRKSKFVQTQYVGPEVRRIKPMLKTDIMNYIVYAACGEDQTSADLGTQGGAFTIYWLKAWSREFTHLQWSNQTAKLLSADHSLDQVPNIDGDTNLMNQIVFI